MNKHLMIEMIVLNIGTIKADKQNEWIIGNKLSSKITLLLILIEIIYLLPALSTGIGSLVE